MTRRNYFDTILGSELSDDSHSDKSITISRAEYDALQRTARDHAALRSALINGGVPPDNLDILINASAPEKSENCKESKCIESPTHHCKSKWTAEAKVFVPGANNIGDWRSSVPSTDTTTEDSSNAGDDCPATPFEQDEQEYSDQRKAEIERFEDNHDDRSLVLRGLSPFTSLADVLKHVRGGQVLNVFKRTRTAHVAFVDPIAAEKFLIYTKRADLYIRGKRIEVFWDDRQHWLPANIARRIALNGASRNLVIRFPKPEMTPETIRDDLEHIHRLEVVDVRLEGGHAFVSLNSVCLALAAKSCMSSRLKYKGTRIEYVPDECDQPLPQIAKKTFKKHAHDSRKAATISYGNRFAVLAAANQMRFGDGDDDALPSGRIGRSVSAGGMVAA